jgi:hypothetical protein
VRAFDTLCGVAPTSDTHPRRRFDALPRRVFLDSSTLQTMLDYGGTVFEGEEPPPASSAFRIPGLLDDLEALRLIFLVNERAMFDFVLSRGSLDEVACEGRRELHPLGARRPGPLAHPCRGIRRHGVRGNGDAAAARADAASLGYFSVKDKHLLRDALALECHGFLTMEKKLPKNAAHIEAQLGLKVLRPPDYWALLRPWAALYR